MLRGLQRAQAAIQTPSTDLTGTDLLDWCYEFLPEHFYGERAEFHQEIADLLADHDRVAVAAPRGHNKSTLISLGYVLWRAATGKSRFILIVSDTATQAADHIGNVQKELLENDKLLSSYPHLKLPELAEYRNKKVRRKASDFITSGGVRFASKGAGGGLRGLREGSQRPDLIVVDDLENDKNVETPRQRQKLKAWFTKSLSNLFGAVGGQLAVIGTILHRESLLNWLIGEQGPAVYVKRKYSAITEDGNALWPAAWTLEKLAAKLDEIKSKAFATEYLNEPGADDAVLFKSEWIDNNRIPMSQNLSAALVLAGLEARGITLTRTVLALDPSTSADGQRDACGISVVGKSVEGHYYVLADLTLNGSPATWARKALDAYPLWDCDELVAEANQGGAMIESTLRAELRDGERLPPVRLVHATKGKAIRAEPTAVEYERGNVHHVGTHGALEIEQVTWVPGTYSPNRLDALVWAMARLMERAVPRTITTTIPQSYV